MDGGKAMRQLILMAAMAGTLAAQDFSHFEVASVKVSAPISGRNEAS